VKKHRFFIFAGICAMILSVLYVVDHALFWRHERDVLVKISRKSAKDSAKMNKTVVFIGDSIMDNFPMASHWGCGFIYSNWGVGGFSVNQIVSQYEKKSISTPRDILVIEGGINDILGCAQREGCSQEGISIIVAEGLKKIIDLELARETNKILITSITPVANKFLLPHLRAVSLPTSYNPATVNSIVDSTNALILKMCSTYNSPRVKYVDISTPLKLDGALNRKFGTADGYHINQEGYEVISSVLYKHIQ
jgi:lysophospholipase L1-like esterase